MSLIPWEGEVMAEDDESSPGKRKPYVPRGRSGPPWLGRGQPHESWLDAVIRQAEAEGHFDNLPGQGKPLPPANPYEALDEWALANHILKQSGFLPDWLQLRKEVEEERPAVVAALDAYRRQREVLDPRDPVDAAALRRLEERYVALATAINRKIDEHNLRRPGAVAELARFQQDAIARLRARGS